MANRFYYSIDEMSKYFDIIQVINGYIIYKNLFQIKIIYYLFFSYLNVFEIYIIYKYMKSIYLYTYTEMKYVTYSLLYTYTLL